MLPLSLLAVIAARTGMLDGTIDRYRFNDLSWFDNTALVEHLRVVAVRDGLTDLPKRCLVFVVNGDVSDNTPVIDVLGRRGNGCPGDKPAADKLFSIKVDRMGRSLQTDAGSPGTFRPMAP